MSCYTYRHWSRSGQVLYVGTTRYPKLREWWHKQRSPWWPQVRNVTYETWPTRTEALWAEWVSIVTEQPPKNKHLVKAGLPFPRPRSFAARVAFRAAMALGEWPNR